MLPTPQSLIPHRPPQLLLTRLTGFEGGKLTAEGDFGVAEWAPAVPGPWLVEGLAQAMACLGRLQGETGGALLLGIPEARFPNPARPPCTLQFDVEVVDRRFRITEATGRVTHQGEVVCTARLTAAMFDEPAP